MCEVCRCVVNDVKCTYLIYLGRNFFGQQRACPKLHAMTLALFNIFLDNTVIFKMRFMSRQIVDYRQSLCIVA